MIEELYKLVEELDEIKGYFEMHNKNLTEKQYYKILELDEIIEKIKGEEKQ